jgi:hypothetical protein
MAGVFASTGSALQVELRTTREISFLDFPCGESLPILAVAAIRFPDLVPPPSADV